MLLFLALLPATLYAFARFQIDIGMFKIDAATFFSFPDVWHFVAYISSWYNLLLGFVVINLVSNEYSYRMFRQQVIDGLSRGQLLGGKLMMIGLLAILSVLFTAICALIMGWTTTKELAEVSLFAKSYYLGALFLQSIAYMCLAALVALVVKRTGLSYVLFLFSSLIEMIFLNFVPAVAHPFFPKQVLGDMVSMPLAQDLNELGAEFVITPLGTALGLGVAYIIVFLGLSYWWLRRAGL